MQTRRFETLDGMRGIAALAVVILHVSSWGLLPRFASHAHLAVDLFFVLSGFVIAQAYEGRLARGGPVGWFVRCRLIRLYPLHVLGVLLGLAATLLAWRLQGGLYRGQPMGLGALLGFAGLGLLFLPLVGRIDLPAFPLNGIAWSLSIELVANLAYAALAPWLTARLLIVLAAAGAVLMVLALGHSQGLDFGAQAANHLEGYARALYSFPVGILLHRWHAAGRLRAAARPAVILAALVALLMLGGGGPANRLIELIIVLVALPALVAVAASSDRPQPSPILARLGGASYALYAIHYPLVIAAAALAQAAALKGTALYAVGAATLACAVGAALAAETADRRVRRWLTGYAPGLRRSLPAAPAS